jgi:hypothetical protein
MDLDSALTGKPSDSAGATDILRADHREMRRLLSEYERVRSDAHAAGAVAQAICMQVELHDALEREIFYPAARVSDPDRVEHDLGVHVAIAEASRHVRGVADARKPLDAVMGALKALVEPHMLEEEQRLFPRVEKNGTAWLHELGAKLVKRKEELAGSADSLENPAT